MIEKAIERVRTAICNVEPSGLALLLVAGILMVIEIAIIGPTVFFMVVGVAVLTLAIFGALYYLLYRFALWAQSHCREKQPKPTLMERVDQKISEQEGSE